MPVFIVDKPLGLSSHEAVQRARRLLGTRRVGHAGTLDPLASGVLLLLSDEATKLSPFLTASRKRYLAWISLGATTPTLDAEGPLEPAGDASGLGAADVARALPDFLPLRQQLPPQYSAVKRGGVRGYEAARRGETARLEPRPARYHELRLIAFAAERDALPTRLRRAPEGWQPQPEGRAFPLPDPLGRWPSALVELEVGAGTYVRAFAHDLGEALGCGAFLSGLARVQAGPHRLEASAALEDLPQVVGLSLAEALPYPKVTLEPAEAERVRQGQRLPLALEGRVGLLDPDGELAAVAEVAGGQMTLLRVWPKESAR